MTVPLLLHETHAAAGARFGLLGQREMVLGYGDDAAEMRALRAQAGVIDWSGGTRLRLTAGGTRQAHDYIQSMLSNAVPAPPTTEGCYATLLTNTGKIIADCRAWARDDGVLLATESDCGPALRDTLAKYGFLDDMVVADISEDVGMLGVYGPRAAALFEQATDSALPGLEPHALLPVETAPGAVRVTRSRTTGEVGFDILANPEVLAALWTALCAAGAAPVGLEAFHVARVEAGVPWMNAELDDRVLPNQAGLDHAISYTKGCFVGQEAVAKLHYLGRATQELIGLLLGDAPPPARDTPLFAEGDPVGRVTSAVVSPARAETIAMAFCKTTCATPGTTVTVGEGISATVTGLPFYAADEAPPLYLEADIRDGAEPLE